jgi:hypothetical protein
VEFVINLVFNDLPTTTVDDLRASPLGVALTVASVTSLLGLLTVTLGIGWLAIWLFNSSSRIQTWSMPTSPALHHLDA